jgi:uncharacterized protein YkwD
MTAKDRAASPPFAVDRAADTAAEATPAAPPSPPSPAEEIVALVNEARRSERLGTLAPDATLQRLAQGQAERMARAGRIFHNASLGKRMLGGSTWTQFGENVAAGPSMAEVHVGLLNSPHHRANILGDFTHVGAGVVHTSDGYFYVVEVFGKASGEGATTGG